MIQFWIVQDDWLEVYVAWKYNFDDNELVIKHKVSHHLDFLSAASHSPVTHDSMKKCSLGRSLNGFISNQSVQSGDCINSLRPLLLFCRDG